MLVVLGHMLDALGSISSGVRLSTKFEVLLSLGIFLLVSCRGPLATELPALASRVIALGPFISVQMDVDVTGHQAAFGRGRSCKGSSSLGAAFGSGAFGSGSRPSPFGSGAPACGPIASMGSIG